MNKGTLLMTIPKNLPKTTSHETFSTNSKELKFIHKLQIKKIKNGSSKVLTLDLF